MRVVMNPQLVLALGLYFLFAVTAQALARKYTQTLPRAQAVVAMYFGAALLAIVVALIVGVADTDFRTTLFIILTGCLSAVASYCQWQAYAHSLSKTSLFLPASDALAVVMAALLLGEALLYQRGALLVAVALLFTAAVLLSWRPGGSPENKEAVGERQWRWWLGGVLIGSAGVTLLMKVFSADVPAPTFLLFYYFGAAVGALLLWLFQKEKWTLSQEKLWPVWLISAAILGALGMSYWSLSLAPVGLVLPIQGFGASLLAVLAGWIFFSEKEQLTWITGVGFILGTIGLLLLSLARLN